MKVDYKFNFCIFLFLNRYNSPVGRIQHQQPPIQEGIYNGSASIRSGHSGSGIFYHQRPYPYPHQRYREPLLPSTTATTSLIAGTSRRDIQEHEIEEEDGDETPG